MNRRPRYLPPVWLALIVSLAGIYGMKLVYLSLTQGGWVRGLLGAVLLVASVVFVGTPLAIARYLRKQMREKSGGLQKKENSSRST
ncbi:hypothetical protein LLE49_05845 [Alicyclobacillus tolerans]|uniref:hypothetical protein n=1 Tax=Alicyclobacillus tolerans TaxID=90970 RepID=UPI001F39FA27|nr:hypothetical protein [Alicyclobacillus tolerans]MCF8564264.1 hypothetical protein [Alicyclobacillus tolerans]